MIDAAAPAAAALRSWRREVGTPRGSEKRIKSSLESTFKSFCFESLASNFRRHNGKSKE
jgi:hypothetical protein